MIPYGPCQANLVLIAYASSESRGNFRQKARSLAPLNGWACAVKICHDGMLEDTNSLDGAHMLCAILFSVEMDLSESPDPDLLFTTDEEKTFQYQDQLPSLPVPDLQHTLDRYLDSGN